jgi:hypothetical protein
MFTSTVLCCMLRHADMHPSAPRGARRWPQLLDEVGGVFKFLTNLFGGTPAQGADTAVWLATAPEAAAISGKLLAKRKVIATPGQGSDPAARKRLWEESARLVAQSQRANG